jgi:hypothetical protein
VVKRFLVILLNIQSCGSMDFVIRFLILQGQQLFTKETILLSYDIYPSCSKGLRGVFEGRAFRPASRLDTHCPGFQTSLDTLQTKHPSHIYRPRVSLVEWGNGARLPFRLCYGTTRLARRPTSGESEGTQLSSAFLCPRTGRFRLRGPPSIWGLFHPMYT